MLFGCCIDRAENIARVKAAGYDYFEFSGSVLTALSEGGFAALKEAQREAGLPCRGLNAYCGASVPIVGEGADTEKARAYAELACVRASQLGALNIGIGAPKARILPEGYPEEKAFGECCSFLRTTAEVAAKYGQQVIFEAVHDKMCNYATLTLEAVRHAEGCRDANIGIVLDFYHMEVMGEELSAAEGVFPYLRHTHISTCEPDLSRKFPPESDREKYREFLHWLKARGYNGSLSVEPSGFDAAEAASCLQMLQELDAEN